jgi:hypothetical protein
MRTRILSTVFFIALAAFSGCGKKEAAVDEKEHLKVVVRADGTILADGARSDLGDLARRLDALKEKKGVVWFYRANPQGEPPPHSMDVMKLVIDKRLPIALFVKEDFSERVSVK